MFIFIAITLGVLCIGAIVYVVLNSLDKKATKAKLATDIQNVIDLIDQAENSHENAKIRLQFHKYFIDNNIKPHLKENQKIRLEKLYKRFEKERATDYEVAESFTSIGLNLQALPNVDPARKVELLETIVQALKNLKYPESVHRVLAGSAFNEYCYEHQCKDMAEAIYRDLCSRAPTERSAFIHLHQLLIRYDYYGNLKRRPWDYWQFPVPTDWNMWVVRYFPDPQAGDFLDVPSVTFGEISQHIKRAIRDQDVVECAIGLARCHRSTKVRTMVGDILYTELLETFVTLRDELVMRE